MSISVLETFSFTITVVATIITLISVLGSILFEKTKEVVVFDGVRETKEKQKTFWYKSAVVVAIISTIIVLAGLFTTRELNKRKQVAAAYQDAIRQAKADSINATLIMANNEIRNPLLPLKIIIDYSIPLDSFNYNIQHFFRVRNERCRENEMKLMTAHFRKQLSWDTISTETLEKNIDDFLSKSRKKNGPSIIRPVSKSLYNISDSYRPDSILYKTSFDYSGDINVFYSTDSITTMEEFDYELSKVGDLSLKMSLFETNDRRVADFLIGADFEKSRTIKISLSKNRAYFSLLIDNPLIENKDNKVNSLYSHPNGFLLIDNDLFEKNGFSLDRIQFECGLTNIHRYIAGGQQIKIATLQGSAYFRVLVADLLKTIQLP